MKATCPICAATYPVPDDKLRGKARGLPVRCKNCGAVFRAFETKGNETVQSPPTIAPWSQGHIGPATPPPQIAKPALHDLEPAARETTTPHKVVRSTFIDQPIPDLENPVLPPTKPTPTITRQDEGTLPEVVAKPETPTKPAVAKPSPLDVPRPEPAEPLTFEPEPSTPEPAPEQLVMSGLIDKPADALQKPLPSIPEAPSPKPEPAEPKPEPPAPAEPLTFEPEPSTPEPAPDYYLDDIDEPRTSYADEEFDDDAPSSNYGDSDDDDIDIHDDDFLKVTRFGEIPKSTQYLVIGVVAAVVLALAYFMLFVNREVDDVNTGVASRNRQAAITHEKGREKLDFQGKYLKGRHLGELGTETAYRKAIELFGDSLAVKANFTPAVAAKALTMALLAVEYAQADALQPACKLAAQAMKQNPEAAYSLRAQAACELAAGKATTADVALQKALTAAEGDDHEDAESNYVRALLYLGAGDVAKAEFTLDGAISQNPNHFRILHRRAALHAQKERWAKAVGLEEKALDLLSPTHNLHQDAIDEAKQRLAKWQNQEQVAVAALTMPEQPEPEATPEPDKKAQGRDHLKRCRAMLNSNNYQAAIGACSTATNYSPDAYYYLGAAYEASGNAAAKKQYYQAYLNARPDGRFASEVRSILGHDK